MYSESTETYRALFLATKIVKFCNIFKQMGDDSWKYVIWNLKANKIDWYIQGRQSPS